MQKETLMEFYIHIILYNLFCFKDCIVLYGLCLIMHTAAAAATATATATAAAYYYLSIHDGYLEGITTFGYEGHWFESLRDEFFPFLYSFFLFFFLFLSVYLLLYICIEFIV